MHVLIALTGIGYSVFLFFKPNKRNFNITYSLIGGTFVSGTILVIITHSSLKSSCIAGLAYLAIVLIAIIPARYRYKKLELQKEYLKKD